MSDFLTPQLTVIALAILVTLAVGGLAYALLYSRVRGPSVADRRLDTVTQSGGAALPARSQDNSAKRRKAVQESLRDMEVKERAKARNRTSPPLDLRLEQAGMKVTKQVFFMFGGIAGLVLLAVSWLGGLPIYVALGLGASGAVGLPFWVVNFRRKRRFKAFLKEFPNSVDIIIRGVKAGLPLNDCLRIVASEAPDPVGAEFRTIHERQSVGLTVSEAIAEMPLRVPVPEANFFAIAIAIQQKAGGNLSEALGNLSKVLRERAKMKGKIKAMSMEAKASAWIIALLPVIVMVLVYITSPDYIMLLFTESLGNAILVASAFWMAIGVLVMRRMINFDF